MPEPAKLKSAREWEEWYGLTDDDDGNQSPIDPATKCPHGMYSSRYCSGCYTQTEPLTRYVPFRAQLFPQFFDGGYTYDAGLERHPRSLKIIPGPVSNVEFQMLGAGKPLTVTVARWTTPTERITDSKVGLLPSTEWTTLELTREDAAWQFERRPTIGVPSGYIVRLRGLHNAQKWRSSRAMRFAKVSVSDAATIWNCSERTARRRLAEDRPPELFGLLVVLRMRETATKDSTALGIRGWYRRFVYEPCPSVGTGIVLTDTWAQILFERRI